MSGAQHTPGPWRVGKGGPNGCPVVGTDKGLLVCMVSHSVNLPSQAEKASADAAVIAAAPDMLKALRLVLDADQMAVDQVGLGAFLVADAAAIQAVRAALSKAEGRS